MMRRQIETNVQLKQLKQNKPNKQRNRQKQKGVALITALLIVSLATIMAVSLISGQYLDVRRTGNIMSSDKAYLQALTMETSAAYLLKFSRDVLQGKFDDREKFKEAVFGINASGIQVAENEARVTLILKYPEALFNVNTLLDDKGKVRAKQKQRFESLLQLVLQDLGQPVSLADGLTDSLLDWLDEDDNDRAYGAEDGIYESKDPPYKTANQSMQTISELQMVEGFVESPDRIILNGIPKDPNDASSEAIPGLLQYVTALPDVNSVFNVNLMSEVKIIQSFSRFITKTMAEDILAAQSAQAFKDVNEFIDHTAWDVIKDKSRSDGGADWKSLKADLKAINNSGLLDVQSSYFISISTADLGNSHFVLNSLVYVNTSGTKLEIVSRAFGANSM